MKEKIDHYLFALSCFITGVLSLFCSSSFASSIPEKDIKGVTQAIYEVYASKSYNITIVAFAKRKHPHAKTFSDPITV